MRKIFKNYYVTKEYRAIPWPGVNVKGRTEIEKFIYCEIPKIDFGIGDKYTNIKVSFKYYNWEGESENCDYYDCNILTSKKSDFNEAIKKNILLLYQEFKKAHQEVENEINIKLYSNTRTIRGIREGRVAGDLLIGNHLKYEILILFNEFDMVN